MLRGLRARSRAAAFESHSVTVKRKSIGTGKMTWYDLLGPWQRWQSSLVFVSSNMPITPSNSSPRLGHFCVGTHVADMSPTLTGHWPSLGPRSSSIIVTTATTCQTECCLARRLKKIKRKGKPEIRTLHRGFLLSTIILLEVSICVSLSSGGYMGLHLIHLHQSLRVVRWFLRSGVFLDLLRSFLSVVVSLFGRRLI